VNYNNNNNNNNNNNKWPNHTSLGPAREACAAAELAASREEEKYASIRSDYLFAPIEVVTMGPMKTPVCQLVSDLRRTMSSASGDDREGAFQF